MRRIQVYVDTSVFGGAFDVEFARGSLALFNRIRKGQINGAVSALVTDELRESPPKVKGLFAEMEPLLLSLEIGTAATSLRRAYLDAEIVGPRWAADALHVAAATVGGCRTIVSWNSNTS